MRYLRECGLVLVIMCTVPSPAQAQKYGRFEGNVVATWPLHERRVMVLTEDFTYVAPDGVRWKAPKGAKVDGASIPRVFWTIVGSPYVGEYRRASVVHDVACNEEKRSWQSVHRMFYTAMRADGVSEAKAKLMYAAVYMGGPKWELRSSPLIGVARIPSVTSTMIRAVSADYQVSKVSVSNAAAGTPEAADAEGAIRVTLLLKPVTEEEPSREEMEAIQLKIQTDESISLDQLDALIDQTRER